MAGNWQGTPRIPSRVPRAGNRLAMWTGTYRLGQEALVDWPLRLQGILTSAVPPVLGQRLRASARLALDYVSAAILGGGNVYSLPVTSQETGDAARALPDTRAARDSTSGLRQPASAAVGTPALPCTPGEVWHLSSR